MVRAVFQKFTEQDGGKPGLAVGWNGQGGRVIESLTERALRQSHRAGWAAAQAIGKTEQGLVVKFFELLDMGKGGFVHRQLKVQLAVCQMTGCPEAD